MNINEIIQAGRLPEAIIADLKRKSVVLPSWETLEKEYDPKKHPVYSDPSYTDKVTKNGIQKVTRISLDWQRLAVKRMTELMFAVPVKRTFRPKTDRERAVAKLMEAIYQRARIDSVNNERGRMLFASCEAVTIWYAQAVTTLYAGELSPLKLRCRNYSPMNGELIYPLFDEYGDMIALSVNYKRTENDTTIEYFDTYTADRHIRWTNSGQGWAVEVDDAINIGKIAGVYIKRNTPIWEDQSDNVSELEWTLSRNGNYLRKNSKPTFAVFSDDAISFGNEDTKDNSQRTVMHYPEKARAEYITWNQSTEATKFHAEFLKQNFFMSLQLPDMSMENIKTTPMSGEARKMVFIDAQLKVNDEKGAWLEAFDRELNVLRAFAKIMFPQYAKEIDSLECEIEVTPFNINVVSEKISNLVNATGGKPIMSQKTAIEDLGYVEDAEVELKQIAQEGISELDEPTL